VDRQHPVTVSPSKDGNKLLLKIRHESVSDRLSIQTHVGSNPTFGACCIFVSRSLKTNGGVA
jgi:hypothetical protein